MNAALRRTRIPRWGVRRRGLLALLLTLAVGLGLVLAPTIPAQARSVTGADFQPGNIISDQLFFDGAAMTESQIQQFLDQMIGVCGNGQCLNVLRVNVSAKARAVSSSTGNVICEALGGGTLTAAAIIYRSQVACGISAKVILVTLQKEQALVTAKNPSIAALDRAMGMACPDTAPCAPTFLGFENQIYQGVKQLKTYSAARFAMQPGVQNIQWHPNAACGATAVNIENFATAALYNYTPYRPNAAALANLGGTGDACSSYGNRNFWVFYNDWFGPTTTDPSPVGSIDVLQSTAPSRVTVRGWAFDPETTASIDIHIYADGYFAWGGTASIPRSDVQKAYPQQGPRHGFEQTFAVSPGNRNICIYALNVGNGSNTLLSCSRVLIAAPPPSVPTGWFDSATVSGTNVSLRGWALDPSTSAPTDVHVYVNGGFATGFSARELRTDVGAAYPISGPNHGFSYTFSLPPGQHSVCAFALNAARTASASLGCKSVSVVAAQPRGYIDGVVGTAGGAQVRGWAFESGSATPVGVHVYVDGRFASGFLTSVRRTDVAMAFPGQGENHGFDNLVGLSPGAHSVCVYALNVAGTSSALLSCSTVRVP